MKRQKSQVIGVRLDAIALAALAKVEKALGPGITGTKAVAIRRALINEAARL